MHIFLHALEHTFLDTIKMIPFIFLMYLLIEFFEHKYNTGFSHTLMKSRRLGPLCGAAFGSIPQCGFSVIASDLFAERAITMGTLIAVFVATSDEAIPILLSHPDKAYLILAVLAIKIVIAILCGFLVDILCKDGAIEKICDETEEHEHFHGNCESCHGGILRSAVMHTIKIFVFLFLAGFALTLVLEGVGEETLAAYLQKGSLVQPFIAALIGLIPNCAASVVLTQSYLSGVLSFGSLIAGLCSGAGVGVLLLFKRNKNVRQNIGIVLLLYGIGVVSGLILQVCL